MNTINTNKKLGTEKVNPNITQDFVSALFEDIANDHFREFKLSYKEKEIPMVVFPGVFPPQSDFSVSSKSVYESFGNLSEKEVADIGTGSGIQSIIAALSGAKHIDAVDISEIAVNCAKFNIKNNHLDSKISVFQGDLLEPLEGKKYDIIIANLPIVDYDPKLGHAVELALYDPNFTIHHSLFSQAKNNLKEGGYITFSHANLQSSKTQAEMEDFSIIDSLIQEYGYFILSKKERKDLDYTWIEYSIGI